MMVNLKVCAELFLLLTIPPGNGKPSYFYCFNEIASSRTLYEKTKNVMRRTGTLTRSGGAKLAAQVREMSKGNSTPPP